jgi:hypothetical protein
MSAQKRVRKWELLHNGGSPCPALQRLSSVPSCREINDLFETLFVRGFFILYQGPSEVAIWP